MSRAVDKVEIHTTVEKSLLEQFRKLFCRRKGDFSSHLENAMRMYILSLENQEAHTHHEHQNISFMDATPPQQIWIGHDTSDKTGTEIEAILNEISSMASVGGKMAKPIIMQAIARATGLKDRRSISSRILILESYGIIRQDPELDNVYEILSLPLQLNKNFK